jgi:subtilase family serine protease
VADGAGELAETQETNNAQYRSILVGNDLQLTAFTVPAYSGAGLTITLSDTTRNFGAGLVEATTTSYYLSANATLDAGDLLLGSRAVPALAAGASSTGSVTVTIPEGTPTGIYNVFAKADAGEVLVETYENNNTLSRSLRVGPDLVVTTLTAPASVASGAALSVADGTRNSGGGGAGASVTRIYLSSNATLDAGDIFLGERAVGALGPAATETGSTSVAIPAGTPAGSYYLIADSDAAGAVLETSETNNRLARAIQVTAP